MPSPNSPLPSQTSQPQFPPGVKPPTSEQATHVVQPPLASKQVTQQQQRASSTAFPGSLSDLVISFENVKQKGEELAVHSIISYWDLTWYLRLAAHRMTNLDQVHKMLEGGHSNVPQPQDTEKSISFYLVQSMY